METEISWQPVKAFRLSSGYQYLFTADKDEWERVKAGKVFTSGANGSVILEKNEYRGLSHRSRHMATFKLSYDNKGRFFTTRLVYRSRWVVATGGSEVNDVNSEFASVFLMMNISAGKELKNGIRLLGGMDNVFNYQDTDYVPNLPGRMIYVGAKFNLVNKQQ